MKKNILLWFPLTAAIFMPVTFLVTYAWAVGLGHVEPDFPYISATGTYPPESCFFSLMLNIISVLLFVTVWVRHRQIEDHCSQTVVTYNLPKTSEVATVFGYAAAFGICLVGNFQATNVSSVHLIGAGMAFGLGNVYLWIQSWMSIHLMPRVNSQMVMVVRFISSATATLMIVLTLLFSYLHDAANQDVAYWSEDPNWWKDEDRQHWEYHIIATSSEWVLSAAFVVVLLSLVPAVIVMLLPHFIPGYFFIVAKKIQRRRREVLAVPTPMQYNKGAIVHRCHKENSTDSRPEFTKEVEEFKRMTFQGVMVEYDRDRDQLREHTNHDQSTETIDTIETVRL